jgi:hypothetical protein
MSRDDWHGDPAYGCGLAVVLGLAFWIGVGLTVATYTWGLAGLLAGIGLVAGAIFGVTALDRYLGNHGAQR